MSEQKWTPGPWKDSGSLGFPHVVDSVGMCVCSMSTVVRSAEESLANARLVAAAPQLLEACKHAVAAIVEPHNDWAQLKSDVAYNKLIVAIEAAEGES